MLFLWAVYIKVQAQAINVRFVDLAMMQNHDQDHEHEACQDAFHILYLLILNHPWL